MDMQNMPGHGPCGDSGMMHGMGMKMEMMSGMPCPVCGEPMLKPTKEEMIKMLEKKKMKFQAVVDHLNMEIEKLKAEK